MIARKKVSIIANWHCRRSQRLSAVPERSVLSRSAYAVIHMVEFTSGRNQESGKAPDAPNPGFHAGG